MVGLTLILIAVVLYLVVVAVKALLDGLRVCHRPEAGPPPSPRPLI